MTHLFSADLETNGKLETFDVSFNNDLYHFKGLNNNIQFDIKREEDEWHTQSDIDNQLKNEAIMKLDAYLLSQH